MFLTTSGFGTFWVDSDINPNTKKKDGGMAIRDIRSGPYIELTDAERDVQRRFLSLIFVGYLHSTVN